MSAGYAPASTALLALIMGPTESQPAFGEPRSKSIQQFGGRGGEERYAVSNMSLTSTRPCAYFERVLARFGAVVAALEDAHLSARYEDSSVFDGLRLRNTASWSC